MNTNQPSSTPGSVASQSQSPVRRAHFRHGFLICFILLTSSLILCAPSAHAQYNYALNYQTNTINVVSNWVSGQFTSYVVGSNTSGNALIINASGVLSIGTALDPGAGVIGGVTGSSNNSVVVNGGTWNNLNNGLFLGDSPYCPGNSLIITNGGAVFNGTGEVGGYGYSNTVLVSGTGSVWNNTGNLSLGDIGGSNTVSITAGGLLHVGGDLRIGINSSFGNGNLLVITNTGQVVVDGLVDNGGTVSFSHSIGTFNNSAEFAVINNGAWLADSSTNVFLNTFYNNGYIATTANGVYVFTNSDTTVGNFVNTIFTSAKSNVFNTTTAEFVFDSTLTQTQDFYTAGLNLGGLANGNSHLIQISLAQFNTWGTNNNFALGTLVDNGMLGIWDAHGVGQNANGGQQAALFVNNLEFAAGAQLLIGSNTWVYYVNQTGLSGATVTSENYDTRNGICQLFLRH